MNKKEFIEEFSKSVGVNKVKGAEMVNAFLSTLVKGVSKEGSVTFIGAFTIKKREVPEKTGMINGKEYHSPASTGVKFVLGNDFRKALNEG